MRVTDEGAHEQRERASVKVRHKLCQRRPDIDPVAARNVHTVPAQVASLRVLNEQVGKGRHVERGALLKKFTTILNNSKLKIWD